MNTQKQFQKLIKMLENSESQPELVNECLRIKNDEITFSSFLDNLTKITTKHIFDVYWNRFEMTKQSILEKNFVIGYEELLSNLQKSKSEFTNVSSIISKNGTYLIFSDYKYLEFMGILKSKRTLTEVRDKMNGSIYFRENIFINGNRIISD